MNIVIVEQLNKANRQSIDILASTQEQSVKRRDQLKNYYYTVIVLENVLLTIQGPKRHFEPMEKIVTLLDKLRRNETSAYVSALPCSHPSSNF